jgi:hypothetical protein
MIPVLLDVNSTLPAALDLSSMPDLVAPIRPSFLAKA